MNIRLTKLTGLFCLAAVSALFSLAPSSAQASSPGPEQDNFPGAFAYAWANPSAGAPGANDWTCRPSASHPRAVVLVHGTFEDQYDNFAELSPELKRAGYCVFALNYGFDDLSLVGLPPSIDGTADIRGSAKELAAFVDKVLAATHTGRVDIVGHSQGGMMPRQYMKFEGGAAKVHTLVSLGATNHGTTLDGFVALAKALGILQYAPWTLGESSAQQVVGSDFLNTLNAGGDTSAGVSYYVIGTRYDEVSTPYAATFLTAGAGATVTNVTLQDGCEIDLSDHVSMTYSPRAIGLVKKALDPSAPDAPCVAHPPVL